MSKNERSSLYYEKSKQRLHNSCTGSLSFDENQKVGLQNRIFVDESFKDAVHT